MRTTWHILLLLALPLGLATAAWAEEEQADADAVAVEESEYQQLLNRVAAQLLAETENPFPDRYVWPPHLIVLDDLDGQIYNAYATGLFNYGATRDTDSGKIRPVVGLTKGYFDDVVQGDEHRLAFIVGHELAHLLLDHVDTEDNYRSNPGQTYPARRLFSRDNEIHADVLGAKLALAAGYRRERGVSGVLRKMEVMGDYTSFEGNSSTHPSWKERLTYIGDDPQLWRSMSAFYNGVYFLNFQQYAAAEKCFALTVEDFPDAYEAWVNLGIARLMLYCDALETEDLRRLGLVAFAANGFMERPESLWQLVPRGVNRNLWQQAVEALYKGLEKSELLPAADASGLVTESLARTRGLAHANLGLAALVHPERSDPQQALEQFDLVAEYAPVLSAQALMVVQANRAAALLAEGEQAEAERAIEPTKELEELLRTYVHSEASIQSALVLSQGRIAAASDVEEVRRGAIQLLEEFLSSAHPASVWRPLVWEDYRRLCEEFGVTLKSPEDLSIETSTVWAFPTAVQVTPRDGAEPIAVYLSEPIEQVQRELGEGLAVPVIRNTDLIAYHYPEHGIRVVGTDRVELITLQNEDAPALKLVGTDPAAVAPTLRIGMPVDELDLILGPASVSSSYRAQFDDNAVSQKFYPDLTVYSMGLFSRPNFMGLSVKVSDDDRVEEFTLGAVPIQP